MKLIFLLTPAVPAEKMRDVRDALATALPGVSGEFDAAGANLSIQLPQDADPTAVSDVLRFRLFSFGIEAKEIYREATPPPVNMPGAPRQKDRRTVSLPVFIVSLIAAVLVVGVLAFSLGGVFSALLPGMFGSSDILGTDPDADVEDYVGKIGLFDQIFKQYSIYDTDGQLLLDQMLKAYAAATGDLYAAYYTEEEFNALMEENGGNAVGVGIMVIESTDPKGVMIISVIKDSPAAAAGVLPGDIIVGIGRGENAVSFADCSYEAALDLLTGDAGSLAEITVLRDGEELQFSITRAPVNIITVTGKVSETDPTVGIVRIEQFDLKTPAQFKEIMESLIGRGCTKFIYDLRNNPGGDLRSVMAVLAFFLEEDDLVTSIVGRDGSTEYEKIEAVSFEGEYADCSIKAEDIGRYRFYGKAVLVNGYSASAAELFTATLRDYELATIVGTTTFGKGILQSIFSLEPFGYKGGMKLTTGYYSPPSGENYDGKGITPHKVVEPAFEKSIYLLTEQEDNQLQAAITALNEQNQ